MKNLHKHRILFVWVLAGLLIGSMYYSIKQFNYTHRCDKVRPDTTYISHGENWQQGNEQGCVITQFIVRKNLDSLGVDTLHSKIIE